MATEVTEGEDLIIPFQITPQVTIVTTVFGADRDSTTEAIVVCGVVAWNQALTPVAPVAKLSQTIQLCGTTVQEGATLTLTPPSSVQPGSVLFNGTITTPTAGPTPYEIVVAVWPLSGHVQM